MNRTAWDRCLNKTALVAGIEVVVCLVQRLAHGRLLILRGVKFCTPKNFAPREMANLAQLLCADLLSRKFSNGILE